MLCNHAWCSSRDTGSGKVPGSGGADFEGFAEGLHGEGDAVDFGGVAEVGTLASDQHDIQSWNHFEVPNITGGNVVPSLKGSDTNEQVAESNVNSACAIGSVDLSGPQCNGKINRVDWQRVQQIIEECLALCSAFWSIGTSDAVRKFECGHDRNPHICRAQLIHQAG